MNITKVTRGYIKERQNELNDICSSLDMFLNQYPLFMTGALSIIEKAIDRQSDCMVTRVDVGFIVIRLIANMMANKYHFTGEISRFEKTIYTQQWDTSFVWSADTKCIYIVEGHDNGNVINIDSIDFRVWEFENGVLNGHC